MAEEHTFDSTVDITDVECPVTFIKAKVSLDEMEVGQVLRIHMNGGKPLRNVPRSFLEDGQQLVALDENDDGTYELYVRRIQ